METGTDGRFYDWHYDYNHNGQLEIWELMEYEEDTFGKEDSDAGSYGSYRGGASSSHNSYRSYSGGTVLLVLLGYLLMLGLFVVGFGLMLVFPPVGALFMLGGYALKDALH